MKLFISWSGGTSQQIAEELRDWIPLLLPAVKPFITSSDIDKGAKWQAEISRELDKSNFGVVCLTKENRNSQWLAFEAGALSKHLEGRVATILFGLDHSDIQPPLSMFQGTRFDETDIRKLILSIDVAVIPEDQRRADGQIEKLFPKLWDEFKESVELILKSSDTSSFLPAAKPDYAELAQEILAQLRQQNTLLSSPERFLEPIFDRYALKLNQIGDRILTLVDIATRERRVGGWLRTTEAADTLVGKTILGGAGKMTAAADLSSDEPVGVAPKEET